MAGALVQRGRLLAGVTIAYNAVEVVLALMAGFSAGSIALVAFGFDSFIELAASAVAIWRLEAEMEPAHRSVAEEISVRLVGVSFLVLGACVAVRAVLALLNQEVPQASLLGMAVAAVSIVAMPLLARAKRRVAVALGSGALHAESTQTSLCAWASAVLLAGLVLRWQFDWWWADPVAAILMTPIFAREGFEALRGRAHPSHPLPQTRH